jgi:hypothetical protein
VRFSAREIQEWAKSRSVKPDRTEILTNVNSEGGEQ